MIDRDAKQFILKALLRAGHQPVADDTLRDLTRSAFRHVAISGDDLGQWINGLKTSGLITDNNDEVFGLMWTLTLAGKPKAQQIP